MSEHINPQELADAVKVVTDTLNEQKSVWAAFQATNDERLAEIAKKGAADPITTEKLGKIDGALTSQQQAIDELHLAMKRNPVKLVDGDGVDLDKKAQDFATGLARRRGMVAPEFKAADLQAYKTGFETWMRKDEMGLSDAERKALSVGVDPDGGFRVHPDLYGRMVPKVFESSPMRAYGGVQVISTDALEGIFDLDEVGSGWVAETGARTETTTPEIGKWRIPVHELYGHPKATQKMLDDADFNVETWLADRVAAKFGRDEAAAFTTGDGVTKPRGFLTYADGTTLPGTIEQFDTGANGAFAANPNGIDVLITALYGLKAQYRNNAVWAMNRATTAAVRVLKDSDGRHLWQTSVAAGQPSTLLGYPVAPFEDMPTMATGSLSVAVADWREAYQIVDRQGVRVIRDHLTAKPYVIFYSVKRVGGDVVNFEAIKLINFKA